MAATAGLQKSGVILVAEQFEDYMRKMQQIQKAHEAAFGSGSSANFQKAQQGVRNEVAQTGKEVDNLKNKTSQMNGGFVGGVTNIVSALGGMKAAVIGVAAALGLMKVVDFVAQSAQVAMRNQELAVVLKTVGTIAGYTSEQMAYGVDVLRKTGITTEAATDSLVKMAQAEIEWTKSAELARIAQDAAVIGSTNSSDAFQRMIWGIKSGQIEILRTMGLNVNFEASYRKLADSLKISTTSLTEQQKVQARVNAVVEEGAKIAGTYEAAMTTAGKQQRSMVRYIEETQASLGKLLLPWEEFKTSLETTFWKGMQDVAKALESWEPYIRAAFKAMEDFIGVIGEAAVALGIVDKKFEFFDALGSGVHNMTKEFVILGAQINTTFIMAISQVALFIKGLGAVGQALTGDIEGALKTVAEVGESVSHLGDMRTDVFNSFIKGAIKNFPDLLKDFKELKEEAAAVDLTPQLSAQDKYIAAQQDVIKGLQIQQQILGQVNKVWENYNKTLTNAAKSRDKALFQADENLNKSIAKLQESASKQLYSIEVKAQKDRQKVIQDANKAIVDQQRAHNREMDNERKRFELSQTQALRQFKNQEKWLMAEGDVIALMQLRDNYNLQQQEAQENYNLGKQEKEQSFKDELQANQRQLQERMVEIETSLAEQRQSAIDSYNEQLADLITANEERKASIQEAYGEQVQSAKDARDQQLQDLGKALQDEKLMTEQGIKSIADVMATLFGEAGAGDALIKGWADRSTTAVDIAMTAIKAQIASVEAMIASVQAGGPIPNANWVTNTSNKTPTFGPWSPTYPAKPMRQGGVGVVTGPALFAIEPGQREAYAFAPVGGRASNLNVNALVSGGIDIRGAEGASAGVVDTAVTTTMRELQEAIRRIGKR
jgi:hypothetical protein